MDGAWGGCRKGASFGLRGLCGCGKVFSMSASVTQSRSWSITRVSEWAVLLGVSVMSPLMVHLIPVPGDSQWGPRLLPLFYAPLLAAWWHPRGAAVLLALLTPLVNHWLTGHPKPVMIPLLMAQLGVFGLFVHLLAKGPLGRRLPANWRPWLAGPLGFVGALVLTSPVLFLPAFAGFLAPVPFIVHALTLAWPGMIILAVLGWVASQRPHAGAA